MGDFNKIILNELATGFTEADYNISDNSQFSLLQGDVVQVDLRPRIEKLTANLDQLSKLKLNSLEYNPVTKKLSLKDVKPRQPKQAGDVSKQNTANPSPQQTNKNDDVLDFLKMVRANGSLALISQLDSDTKRKIADAIYNLVDSQVVAEEDYNILNEAFEMAELKDPKNKRQLKKAVMPTTDPHNKTTEPNDPRTAGYDDLEQHLKDRKDKLTRDEVTDQDVNDKTADVTSPKPTVASPANPKVEPKKVSGSPKIGDLLIKPGEYRNDPRIKHIIGLKKELENYSKITDANASGEAFLGVVDEPASGDKVNISILKPTSRDPKSGKTKYSTGQKIIIKKNSVVKRTPAEKAKGFLGKVAGWFTG